VLAILRLADLEHERAALQQSLAAGVPQRWWRPRGPGQRCAVAVSPRPAPLSIKRRTTSGGGTVASSRSSRRSESPTATVRRRDRLAAACRVKGVLPAGGSRPGSRRPPPPGGAAARCAAPGRGCRRTGAPRPRLPDSPPPGLVGFCGLSESRRSGSWPVQWRVEPAVDLAAADRLRGLALRSGSRRTAGAVGPFEVRPADASAQWALNDRVTSSGPEVLRGPSLGRHTTATGGSAGTTTDSIRTGHGQYRHRRRR